ncbi:integrase catalytic domain-containing protein [Trichonephila clavipes]|uniref:Integrase catalytic domain-containing protein n=1 Tax=Trichonephila clavipes TaxID=2585209 RepID=A0A8X6SYE5_TRICX|nr:integrase catalytic domain-containing protein [Trichonephila clavipes]
MANVKFELRGWEFTDSNGSTPQPEISKVLGMLWNRKNDTESWNAKLGWDDELPKDITEKFKKWFKNLHLLKLVEIPRYMSMNNCVSINLHIFCDASKLSYATAIFLKSESESQVSVQLVLAKSRIAPLKAMSIPKLELMACIIGVRLTDMVKKALSIKYIEEYYWADSTSVLYWINHDDIWTVFVKNRVKEIRNLTERKRWRHVPGSENPADLPSRGCSAKKLIESRWWEGCQRHSTKAIRTISVSLPEERIREASIFEVVGIDLASPLILKDGTEAWFASYTCAVFRAINLELLTSLSTNCFLLSLRRCIARRGRPRVIYSDNGTNFTGACNPFKAIDWKMIVRESEAVNRRIT